MTITPGARSCAEIRSHLKDRLNQALRRPGMFGGETALRLIFDHLAHAGGGRRSGSRRCGRWSPGAPSTPSERGARVPLPDHHHLGRPEPHPHRRTPAVRPALRALRRHEPAVRQGPRLPARTGYGTDRLLPPVERAARPRRTRPPGHPHRQGSVQGHLHLHPGRNPAPPPGLITTPGDPPATPPHRPRRTPRSGTRRDTDPHCAAASPRTAGTPRSATDPPWSWPPRSCRRGRPA